MQYPGAVFLTDDEWVGIDAEIRSYANGVARRVLKLRGGQQLSRPVVAQAAVVEAAE